MLAYLKPKTLFARMLVIILVPLILVQIITFSCSMGVIQHHPLYGHKLLPILLLLLISSG